MKRNLSPEAPPPPSAKRGRSAALNVIPSCIQALATLDAAQAHAASSAFCSRREIVSPSDVVAAILRDRTPIASALQQGASAGITVAAVASLFAASVDMRAYTAPLVVALDAHQCLPFVLYVRRLFVELGSVDRVAKHIVSVLNNRDETEANTTEASDALLTLLLLHSLSSSSSQESACLALQVVVACVIDDPDAWFGRLGSLTDTTARQQAYRLIRRHLLCPHSTVPRLSLASLLTAQRTETTPQVVALGFVVAFFGDAGVCEVLDAIVVDTSDDSSINNALLGRAPALNYLALAHTLPNGYQPAIAHLITQHIARMLPVARHATSPEDTANETTRSLARALALLQCLATLHPSTSSDTIFHQSFTQVVQEVTLSPQDLMAQQPLSTSSQHIEQDPSLLTHTRFASLARALTLCVPHSPEWSLRVQHRLLKQHRLQRPSVSDLLDLIATRLDDIVDVSHTKVIDLATLNNNNNNIIINHKGKSKIVNSVSATTNEGLQAASRAVHDFGLSNNQTRLPVYLLQWSLFRKPFFLREFLPALLFHPLVADDHDQQHTLLEQQKRLVRTLDLAGKIPPSLMTSYAAHLQSTDTSTSPSRNPLTTTKATSLEATTSSTTTTARPSHANTLLGVCGRLADLQEELEKAAPHSGGGSSSEIHQHHLQHKKIVFSCIERAHSCLQLYQASLGDVFPAPPALNALLRFFSALHHLHPHTPLSLLLEHLNTLPDAFTEALRKHLVLLVSTPLELHRELLEPATCLFVHLNNDTLTERVSRLLPLATLSEQLWTLRFLLTWIETLQSSATIASLSASLSSSSSSSSLPHSAQSVPPRQQVALLPSCVSATFAWLAKRLVWSVDQDCCRLAHRATSILAVAADMEPAQPIQKPQQGEESVFSNGADGSSDEEEEDDPLRSGQYGQDCSRRRRRCRHRHRPSQISLLTWLNRELSVNVSEDSLDSGTRAVYIFEYLNDAVALQGRQSVSRALLRALSLRSNERGSVLFALFEFQLSRISQQPSDGTAALSEPASTPSGIVDLDLFISPRVDATYLLQLVLLLPIGMRAPYDRARRQGRALEEPENSTTIGGEMVHFLVDHLMRDCSTAVPSLEMVGLVFRLMREMPCSPTQLERILKEHETLLCALVVAVPLYGNHLGQDHFLRTARCFAEVTLDYAGHALDQLAHQRRLEEAFIAVPRVWRDNPSLVVRLVSSVLEHQLSMASVCHPSQALTMFHRYLTRVHSSTPSLIGIVFQQLCASLRHQLALQVSASSTMPLDTNNATLQMTRSLIEQFPSQIVFTLHNSDSNDDNNNSNDNNDALPPLLIFSVLTHAAPKSLPLSRDEPTLTALVHLYSRLLAFHDHLDSHSVFTPLLARLHACPDAPPRSLLSLLTKAHNFVKQSLSTKCPVSFGLFQHL